MAEVMSPRQPGAGGGAAGKPAGYPALGFDPAPGTAGKAEALAQDFGRVARELGEAHSALIQIGRGGGIWQGEAAEKFQARLGELPGFLDKAHRSLGDGAKALGQWASDLSSMQTTAAHYEAQAAEARQRLNHARSNPDLGLAGRTFTDAQSLQQAESRYHAAAAELNTAQRELNDIRDMAKRLLAQHEDLASQVANALKRAKDEAIKEPGFFDRLGEAFDKFAHGVADLAAKTWQWVKDHAEDIKKIGDVLSTVSSVLGVIAIATAAFEPVGAIFAAAAGVTSVAAMAAHGVAKAAGADVSWTSIAGDALGAVPFVGGVAKGAKIASLAKNAGVAANAATAARATKIASSLQSTTGKAMSLVEKAGMRGSTKLILKGEGMAGRLVAAGEGKIAQGELLGTKGYNMVAGLVEKIPSLKNAGVSLSRFDPLSGVGRAVDAGIGSAKIIGTEVYKQLSSSSGNPPPPAGQTFNSRVSARASS